MRAPKDLRGGGVQTHMRSAIAIANLIWVSPPVSLSLDQGGLR